MNGNPMDLPLPVGPRVRAEEKHGASEFVQTAAARINEWLRATRTANKDRHWRLMAFLPSGEQLEVDNFGAHGLDTIRLEGKFTEGTPFMLLSHVHSVQILATYGPRQEKEVPKREIGFHTGVQEIRVG
jgi:hypothetical protein